MKRLFEKIHVVAGLAVLLLALPVDGSVNKSITVDDGAQSSGESSVNGSITVGDNATVTGELSTVNGAIRVGEGSAIASAGTVNGSLKIAKNVNAENLETVNGAINIAEGVEVRGNVSAVNGAISLDEGSSIARSLSNVNGKIRLTASTVGENVSTVSGDVELSDGAVISGDLIIAKPGGFFWSRDDRKSPKIVIGPGCRVEGVIRLDQEVQLFISDTAEVGGVDGKMTIADAVRFSGKRP